MVQKPSYKYTKENSKDLGGANPKGGRQVKQKLRKKPEKLRS
jgi:hypothetical protein